MTQTDIYDVINPIIPFPKDEWRHSAKNYNFFNLITFHELELQFKADLEWEVIRNEVLEEVLWDEIIRDEVLTQDDTVIICCDRGCHQVNRIECEKYFFEKYYDVGSDDYFFIYPNSKLILVLNHDHCIFRCDISDFQPKRVFYHQFRIARQSSLDSTEKYLIANKYRYELSVNDELISEYRIARIEKELEKIGLTVKNLVVDKYPTTKFLLSRQEVQTASGILEKYGLTVTQRDKQKDKAFLKVASSNQ